ncbi:MAG: YdjY domain-containing protein [Isosphaeraceae bacterium]|nr:YdjY domain-containing protein [Isosphaeraceae bacterium]
MPAEPGRTLRSVHVTAPSLTFLALALVSAPPAEAQQPPPADSFQPEAGWRALGPSLWFDPAKKQLVMRARVVLREGPLEHLLCLKGTKEHEAILATAAIPIRIKAGLLLTDAEPGSPVRFLPEFRPPTGVPIVVDLQWEVDGKRRRADARRWVLDERSKKPLAIDWVFAGSELLPDPVTKKNVFTADDGDLITVANFASAILDLPFASTANDADRVFSANTPEIPQRGTFVTMFLYPRKTAPSSKP